MSRIIQFLITWGGDIPAIIPSTVVVIRDDSLFAETGIAKEILVSRLMHKAVMKLANTPSQEKAW